jgi:hypothetical protein
VANPNLTPEQQAQYQLLNTRYRNLFGSSNFGDFDYQAYTSDPTYSQRIWSIATQGGNQQQKQQALSEITDFWKNVQSPNFQTIDPKPYFDPLRGDIDKLAGQSLQNAQGQISQNYTNAQNQASNALAGTGFGRSGVAVNAFQGLAERGANELSDAAQGIEEARAKAQLAISMKESEFALSEQLAGRSWDLSNIKDAVAFQRQLWGMQFESDLQQSEEDWADTWGPVIGAALGTVSFPIGGG